MYNSSATQIIQPIREIGCMARAYHIPFHTDAVQALGHIPVNVNDLQVDYLSASAHKLYGPKGIGFLYMRRGKALFPLLYGGAQERNRRAGTENVAAAVGFARALTLVSTEMAQEATRQIQIRDALIIQLASLGCRLNGDPQCRLPNNVHVLLPGWEGEKMVRALNRRGFAVSSGSACASGSPEPSHVLRAIGLSHEQAFEGLRITIGRKTTMQDAEALVQALTDILHENSSQ
ncbi:MAG: aminotransferase class V-fold PLP-dependent enzyme [Clostridia bacterium]|nr:aminotransferase class V-fold PLP-dependent enzyme [Clostridia bacterium]